MNTLTVNKHNTEISTYTITNKNGVEAHLTNYGATLLSLYVPTKNGKIDVVLGFHSIDEYIKAFRNGSFSIFFMQW